MRTRATLLLTLTLLWTACQPATPPPPTSAVIATEEPTRTPAPSTATPLPAASPTPTSNRNAAFIEVKNIVEARNSEVEAYAPASPGLTLAVGGQAHTGEDSRARLDLSPDATIIRLAPNTIFTLTSLEEKELDPFTRLQLWIGQIFIILSGGELEVVTPSGVATVSGSMLSVSYNPEDGSMTAACLEGHCRLQTRDNFLELTAGQAADIRDGVLSTKPRSLTDFELQNWLENAPELFNRPDLLPTLRDRIKNLPPLPHPRRP